MIITFTNYVVDAKASDNLYGASFKGVRSYSFEIEGGTEEQRQAAHRVIEDTKWSMSQDGGGWDPHSVGDMAQYALRSAGWEVIIKKGGRRTLGP